MATYRDGVKRKGDKIGMGLYYNSHIVCMCIINEVVPKSLFNALGHCLCCCYGNSICYMYVNLHGNVYYCRIVII